MDRRKDTLPCEHCGMTRRLIRWLIRYLWRLDRAIEQRECDGKHSHLAILGLACRALSSGDADPVILDERRKQAQVHVIRREDSGDQG